MSYIMCIFLQNLSEIRYKRGAFRSIAGYKLPWAKCKGLHSPKPRRRDYYKHNQAVSSLLPLLITQRLHFIPRKRFPLFKALSSRQYIKHDRIRLLMHAAPDKNQCYVIINVWLWLFRIRPIGL